MGLFSMLTDAIQSVPDLISDVGDAMVDTGEAIMDDVEDLIDFIFSQERTMWMISDEAMHRLLGGNYDTVVYLKQKDDSLTVRDLFCIS